MELAAEDIREVGECFTQAFNHTLANTFGESKLKVMEFVYDVVLRKHPWMMLTQQGLVDLVSEVFGNVDVRDFVLTLTFNFQAYLGHGREFHEGLATVMGVASGYQVPSLIPKPVHERMVTDDVATSSLVNNRWLVCILLLKTWIQAPDPDAPAEKGTK